MRESTPITHLRKKNAFTLVEMLVSITVLVLLLGILFTITNGVSKTIVYTASKVDAFASGRAAFDLMSQKLSQATLNTYWDYDNPVTPLHYYRQSDLQFVVKQNVNSQYGQEVYFVTPSTYSTVNTLRSTDGLLNACGFFVSYCPDSTGTPATSIRPTPLPAAVPVHYRYRLIQGLEPTENLSAYVNWPAFPVLPANPTPAQLTAYTTAWSAFWPGAWATFWANRAWITTSIGNPGTGTLNTNDTPLANNVIALIVWPRLSIADDAPGSTTDGSKLAVAPAPGAATYPYDSQYEAIPAAPPQPLWANQLPPNVQVTMIVISEATASRLEQTKTGGPTNANPPQVIENALNGAGAPTGTPVVPAYTAPFITSTYTQYQTDLSNVSKALTANNIAFQILTTTVTMKESKWSD